MKYDDLYSNYEDDELEVRLALEMTGIPSEVAAEAAKLYQMGKAQDLVYVEKVLAVGSNLRVVNNIVKTNIRRRAQSRPKFDQILRKALKNARGLPDKEYEYQAHHIVAKGAKRAQRAVAILQSLGIDVDDPANGVFLPADEPSKKGGALKKAYVHANIHTKAYYANINFQVITQFRQTANMNKEDRREEMIDLLDEVADQLRDGTYPIDRYIPGAERFV